MFAYVAKCLFSIEVIGDSHVKKIAESIPKVGFIDHQHISHPFNLQTTLDSSDSLIESLFKNPAYFVLKGLISDNLIQKLLQSIPTLNKIPIIIQDSTKLMISPNTFQRFLHAGGQFKVLHPISLICITANPYSPSGYTYPASEFLKGLRSSISLPIFDVMGEL